jgi:uncharacterized damage-inducible protein DinB
MNRNYLTQIANFNNWANTKAMEWLQQINDEQWEQVIVSSFSSLRQTAIHIISAEKYWADHWKEIPEPVFFSREFKGAKYELMEIWSNSSAKFTSIVESYPEENYLQSISFRYPGNGRTGEMPFWQTVAHAINHSTYHRGQLVTLLRQAGFSNLSSLDMATYFQLNIREH